MTIEKAKFNSHLRTYKKIHEGNEVVIMCTGDSLQYYVPIVNENVIHIGVNRIYDHPKYMRLVKYYFFGSQYESDKKHRKNINAIDKNIKKFASTYRDGVPTGHGNITPESVIKIGAIPFECGLISFTDEIADNKILGHSIVFPALQFALYAGFKKIYIVGSDIHGFYDQANEQHLLEWWLKFKSWVALTHPNVEIVSVNPVGLKGFFSELWQEKPIKETFWRKWRSILCEKLGQNRNYKTGK